MSVRIFTIPFDPTHDLFQDDELRAFLLNKHIRTLRPEFFQRKFRNQKLNMPVNRGLINIV